MSPIAKLCIFIATPIILSGVAFVALCFFNIVPDLEVVYGTLIISLIISVFLLHACGVIEGIF